MTEAQKLKAAETRRRNKDARLAEATERVKAMKAAFAARVKAADPNDPLTNDHHWNPSHPNYNPDCYCGELDGPAATTEPTVEIETAGGTGVQLPRSSRKRTASPKQLTFLGDLIEQASKRLAGTSVLELAREAMTSEDPAEVSSAIEDLKKLLQNLRPNKFAGPCELCGQTVEAGKGIIKKNGRWMVYHGPTADDCPAQVEITATTEQVTNEEPRDDRTGLDLTPLPSGRYAVPGGDTRLKVKIDNLVLNPPRNPKWAGFIFVKDAAEYGAGKRYGMQSPTSRYRGEIEEELKKILADPMAAMAAYGHLTNTCGVCGRMLEDEESVERGIGPVCAKKFRG